MTPQQELETLVDLYSKQRTFYAQNYDILMRLKKKELGELEQSLQAGAQMSTSQNAQTHEQYFANGPLYGAYMPCGRGWYHDLLHIPKAKEGLAKGILMISNDPKLWDYKLTEWRLKVVLCK